MTIDSDTAKPWSQYSGDRLYGSIYAVTVDGQRIEVNGLPWAHIPQNRVKTLTISLPRPSAFEGMRAFLQTSSMPHLSKLAVALRDDVNPSSVPAPAAPPMIDAADITPQRFPALDNIKLENVALRLTPSMASRLCVLFMEISTGPPMPLAPFLEWLGALSLIERLSLKNCFARPTSPPGNFVGGRPPLDASQLDWMQIYDHPSNISHIMSALIVPETADVALHGNALGASVEQCGQALLAMLPRDRRCLPALQLCQYLEVVCTRAQFEVNANLYPEDGEVGPRTLDLTLNTDFYGERNHLAGRERAQLFGVFMQLLRHVFPVARVTELKLRGDVQAISPPFWTAILSQFPALGRFTVDDENLQNFPAALFTALCGFQPPPRTLLCPALVALEVHAGLMAFGQLEGLYRCLESRRLSGGPAMLRHLEVEVWADEHCPETVLVDLKRKFDRLCRDSRLEIIVQPGPRTR